MTNKEQIMIDGVDVSGCDFLAKEDIYNSYSGVTTAYKGQCGCSDDEMCKDHRNCGYKKLARQLQRKTQECEELLKENQQLRNSLSDSLMFKFTGQENETNRYRKALEEIEEIVKINCEEICGRKLEDCNDFLCTSKNIIDIINKAKDGNNE